VSYFIQKFNARLKKSLEGVEAEAMERLAGYGWPGNIRELENVLERAILFCDTQRVRLIDLPVEVREGVIESPQKALPVATGDSKDGILADGLKEQVKAAMSRLERELIVRALDQTGGNVTHAARLLKISRKGLQLKMKELGLREREERGEPS
jgi:two-component system, NtrC family, response regulator AtoC